MAGNGRRRFGSIRKLASGRYQVRYRGPDGRLRPGPGTYARAAEASRALALIEAQLARSEWTDPSRAKVSLGSYAERWIAQRPNLRPRTVELYEWLLARHIAPYLGSIPLGKLDTPLIREWRSTLLQNGVSVTMAAKSYRLLRAVLTTAVHEDHLLPKNPCRISGADVEKAAERPVLTVRQVFSLADSVPARYRALILVATFASLRYGQVIALQRADVDTAAGVVRIRQGFTEQRGKGLVLGPPKSRAGRRVVAIPAAIVPALADHLAVNVEAGEQALVFTGPTGKPIRRGNFNKLVGWKQAAASIGAPDLHFHDLRHTGNTLAASAGASTRDLMARMGHDSMNAAIIYQHASSAADRLIAESLNAQVQQDQEDDDNGNGPVAGSAT